MPADTDTLARLRAILIESGLPLREVQRRAGVDVKQVSRLRDGQPVSLPTVERIAAALGYRLTLEPARG